MLTIVISFSTTPWAVVAFKTIEPASPLVLASKVHEVSSKLNELIRFAELSMISKVASISVGVDSPL